MGYNMMIQTHSDGLIIYNSLIKLQKWIIFEIENWSFNVFYYNFVIFWLFNIIGLYVT
jgi:hypothetical protein